MWGGDTAPGTPVGGTIHCACPSPVAGLASAAHPLLSSPSYEVQLESKVRRKGLGKFLIQILQLVANR